jgi:hypothetical protein
MYFDVVSNETPSILKGDGDGVVTTKNAQHLKILGKL